ncbi:hypothetical protein FCV25MIE_12264 [Fagus crenata]
MQSRLAATATRSSWVFSLANNQALRRGFAPAAAGRTADPAIHSGEGQESVADADTERQETEHKPRKETGPFAPPRTPYGSSPRLQSNVLNQPLDPIIQQKRRHCHAAATSLEEVSWDQTRTHHCQSKLFLTFYITITTLQRVPYLTLSI